MEPVRSTGSNRHFCAESWRRRFTVQVRTGTSGANWFMVPVRTGWWFIIIIIHHHSSSPFIIIHHHHHHHSSFIIIIHHHHHSSFIIIHHHHHSSSSSFIIIGSQYRFDRFYRRTGSWYRFEPRFEPANYKAFSCPTGANLGSNRQTPRPSMKITSPDPVWKTT